MKRSLIFTLLLSLTASAFAQKVNVMLDENGDISPARAEAIITNCASAVVQVEIAEAKATLLTNIVTVANRAVNEAANLFSLRTDYALVNLFATGLTDATSTNAVVAEGEIRIRDMKVQHGEGESYVELTWQYVQGSFNHPEILCSTTLSDEQAWQPVTMSEPEQIAWGDTVAYRATATLDDATFGARAFLKVTAEINAPVDDGKVFDIYSDGGGYTGEIIFRPSQTYRQVYEAGRLIKTELVLQ